jgi:hypothetical protein
MRRAERCAHGFIPGICTTPGCKHWDGLRTAREKTSKTPRVKLLQHRVKAYVPSFRSMVDK